MLIVARQAELSPGDWAVLGVVGEGPTHGFAVAGLLAPDGALGQVWTLPRPMVYQSVNKLLAAGMIREQGTERTRRGPARTIVAISAAGRTELDRWLAAPVEHVRDLRSMLLLKLALSYRSGRDTRGLLEAQQRLLAPQRTALERLRDDSDGFDRLLAQWRLASSQAAEQFVAVVLAERAGS